jgi:ribosomal protein L7/L12
MDYSAVVRDVQYLVSQYDLETVQLALNFIRDYPQTNIKFVNDGYGHTWKITKDQFKQVMTTYVNGQQKISAIKLFREITGCGLKEAKDAVEYMIATNWT